MRLYRRRMEIEESFRDMKSLLGLGDMMSKKQTMMEKLVGFLLQGWALCCFLEEKYARSFTAVRALQGGNIWAPATFPSGNAAGCEKGSPQRSEGTLWGEKSLYPGVRTYG